MTSMPSFWAGLLLENKLSLPNRLNTPVTFPTVTKVIYHISVLFMSVDIFIIDSFVLAKTNLGNKQIAMEVFLKAVVLE